MVEVIDVQGGEDRWLFNKRIGSFKNIDTTAIPGVLIRSTTSGKEAHIMNIFISNDTAGSRVVDFYDQDSTQYISLIVAAGSTAELKIDPSIDYGSNDIYARTDSGDVDVTISGVEF